VKKLKVLVVYANCMMDNLIPVGISAVIGSLHSFGAHVELFDTTFYRTEERPADYDRVANLQVPDFQYEEMGISIHEEDVFAEFRAHVLRFKPDLIMLSVVEPTWGQGQKLLKAIRDIRPYVVTGGVFAIMDPETILSNDLVDAVCIGEGENVLPEFCRRFSAGNALSDVAGFWVKTAAGIRRNQLAPLVNINTAPLLDFSLFPPERFFKPMQGRILKMVPVEFSRGCPYRCTYCANHVLEQHFAPSGKWYRWKNLDRIFYELETFAERYSIELFYFISESFLSMSEAMFGEFCDRYMKLRIPFWFNTRPETITEKKARMLEEIGCFRIGIGLEHGNPEFRKRVLNRKVSNKRIIEACRIIEHTTITYSINNIIGFPGETREQIFDTIFLNRQIKPNSVGTFVFTPFKGTSLYNYCMKHGYIDESTPVGDLNRGSVLINNSLTHEEIAGMLRTFPLYVHFAEEMFPIIEKAEKFSEKGNQVFSKLSERYTREHFLTSKPILET
jgi:radical SAM superfamily enzyme YgiQ (UPF0313 family)